MPGRDDLVVERFELAHDAPVQHDGRAVRGAGERERPAEPAGRAGDEDHAAGERVGCGARRRKGSGIGEVRSRWRADNERRECRARPRMIADERAASRTCAACPRVCQSGTGARIISRFAVGV